MDGAAVIDSAEVELLKADLSRGAEEQRALQQDLAEAKKELEDAMALRQKQQAEHDDLAAVWLLSFPACMIGARWLRSRVHGDSLAALLPGGRVGVVRRGAAEGEGERAGQAHGGGADAAALGGQAQGRAGDAGHQADQEPDRDSVAPRGAQNISGAGGREGLSPWLDSSIFDRRHGA
eukprot:COSAG01_NODE_2531_length_7495_cov_6.504191_8_plen_178_part_00